MGLALSLTDMRVFTEYVRYCVTRVRSYSGDGSGRLLAAVVECAAADGTGRVY